MKNIKPRNIFLIDALGAFVSFIMLGFVLPNFDSLLGIPVQVLFILSFLAFLLSIYSSLCYFYFPDKWKPYLKAIAIANGSYCIFTFLILTYYFDNITIWCWFYFIIEILIIFYLVRIEWNKAE